MRPIKFRAWDGFQKKMFDITTLRLPHREDLSPEVYLMQFTGLLDKNGKEIYEGDIVQVSNEDGEQRHGGVVKYIAPKFFVMDGEKSGLFLTNKYEVIGNIYETPNLI